MLTDERHTYTYIDRHARTRTDRQTHRKIDRQTHTHTGRLIKVAGGYIHTERQTDRRMYMHGEVYASVCLVHTHVRPSIRMPVQVIYLYLFVYERMYVCLFVCARV